MMIHQTGRIGALYLEIDNRVIPNVYVGGYTAKRKGNLDLSFIKYDGKGKEQWVERYDEGYSEIPSGIALFRI